MTLRDDILTDAPAAWFDPDGLAQTVAYTVKETDEVLEIPALILYQENLGGTGRYLTEEMEARVRAADVEEPKDGDSLVIGGDTWTVRKITAGNGFHWTLKCTKGVRATQRGQP